MWCWKDNYYMLLWMFWLYVCVYRFAQSYLTVLVNCCKSIQPQWQENTYICGNPCSLSISVLCDLPWLPYTNVPTSISSYTYLPQNIQVHLIYHLCDAGKLPDDIDIWWVWYPLQKFVPVLIHCFLSCGFGLSDFLYVLHVQYMCILHFWFYCTGIYEEYEWKVEHIKKI